MQKALIGKKIGMTQIFDEKGKVVPVTVVEAGPCVVSQVKTVETDGYEAIQVGFGEKMTRMVQSVEGLTTTVLPLMVAVAVPLTTS